MNVKKILESGLINTAMLAREIWNVDPEDKNACKSAAVRMNQKIKESNKQRLTENDLEIIEKYLKEKIK